MDVRTHRSKKEMIVLRVCVEIAKFKFHFRIIKAENEKEKHRNDCKSQNSAQDKDSASFHLFLLSYLSFIGNVSVWLRVSNCSVLVCAVLSQSINSTFLKFHIN